ncbi:MAG: hypothetical protein ACREIF_06810 [Chthoniobacterales bacterium]
MAGGGVDVLSITVDRVDVAPLPPLPPGVDPNDVQSRFLSFVQSFGGQSLPLNLANSVVGSGTNIINTGMAVSSDLQRIAFRQEIGGGIEGDPSIWQDFYSGNFQDRLQDSSSKDQSFGVFESAAVLENAAVLQISNGLNEQAADQAKNPQPVYFQLVTGIGSSFSVNGGTPTITTSFSGNLNTPACSVWTDVTVVSGLSMNQPNTITIDTNYSWNTDTTACTVLAGALGTALGIFADFIVPMGALILEPFLFGVSGIAAVLVAKNVAAPPPFSIDNCQQVSDTHLVCTQSISVQNSPLGSVSINTLQPQEDGIAVLGNLLPIPVGNPQLLTSIERDFVWQAPHVSCGEISGNEVTKFSQNPQNYVSLIANASITAQGLAPIFLISASVINDPLKVFAPYLTVEGTQAPIELTVNPNYPGAQYFANPYPCEILVLTTGGARLISIPAPRALTELTIKALAAQIAGQILFCQKMVDQWWNLFHRYNPVWSVDPGIGENAVEHGYEIEISGLPPGETATLVGERGQVLQTGVAQAGSTLRLNAIVSPAGAGEIGVVRGVAGQSGATQLAAANAQGAVVEAIGAQGPTVRAQGAGVAAQPSPIHEETTTLAAPAGRGIAVKEQLIVQAGSITLSERCRRLAAGYLQGTPCALVVTPSRALAFDLSNPAVPVARFSWKAAGLQGIVPAQPQMLLGYGQDGFVWLDSSGVHTTEWGGGYAEQPEVYQVVAAHGLLYALTSRGLEVLSLKLNRRSTVPLEHSRSLAFIGNKLVAGGRKGLTIFHLGDPARPEPSGFHHTAAVADLVVPPGSSGHQLLAVPYQGHAQLLDFTHHGETKVVATLPVMPWYVGGARLKNLILRLNPDRTAVVLSYFGRSITV